MKSAITRPAVLAIVAGTLGLSAAAPAFAHVHHVFQDNPNAADPGTTLANGQNHPGFSGTPGGTISSCEGVNEPPDSGPAWYGLETAHHGPEEGTAGRADGCYESTDADPSDGILRPADTNPAID